MNKKSKKLIFGTANKRQRYPIRKLTICAASVLLDTTFLFGAGQTVQADTTGQESEQKEETVQLNKDETAYVRITQTIHYVKYGLTGEDSIASSDVVQDGKSNIIHSNNSHVKDFNKEIDGHNQIAYETIQRDYDVVTGLMADSNESISMLRTYVIFGDQTNPAIDK